MDGLEPRARTQNEPEAASLAHPLPVDSDVPWRPVARPAGPARWDVLAVIAVGGAVGSLARWLVAEALPLRPGGVPWATLAVNVAGSLLLGVLMALVADVLAPSRYLRPFLGVGVLGGFTTYSTYMLETRDLLAGGHPGMALGYLLGSLAAGLIAVSVGVAGTRLMALRRRRRHVHHRAAGGPDAA